MKYDSLMIKVVSWTGTVFASIVMLWSIMFASEYLQAVAMTVFGFSPIAAIYLAWVLASRYVALKRGRTAGEGIVMGVLFGPLGPLVVGAMPVVMHRAREAARTSSTTKTTSNPASRSLVISASSGR